jgi:exopolysaccharide production protein ExoY
MEETTSIAFTSFSTNVQVRHIPIKRCFDILFSFCALIVTSPLLLLIMLLISITSKGKAIYRQTRVGRGGKSFSMYKFRTMYVDGQHRLEEYLKTNPSAIKDWEEKRKLKDDPRVTPLGRFLRITSVDELPQFINVLMGDLSVVGPRPVPKEELERFYGPIAPKVLSVRPGITGHWQVSGRSCLNYQERVALDEEYIDRQSFFFDMYLIIKTIPAMILGRGAY